MSSAKRSRKKGYSCAELIKIEIQRSDPKYCMFFGKHAKLGAICHYALFRIIKNKTILRNNNDENGKKRMFFYTEKNRYFGRN